MTISHFRQTLFTVYQHHIVMSTFYHCLFVLLWAEIFVHMHLPWMANCVEIEDVLTWLDSEGKSSPFYTVQLTYVKMLELEGKKGFPHSDWYLQAKQLHNLRDTKMGISEMISGVTEISDMALKRNFGNDNSSNWNLRYGTKW